jgi:hypothetical protein
VSAVDVAEYSDNKGNANVFIKIVGKDLVHKVCGELTNSKEHNGVRVMLEPGPILILRNTEGKIEAAFQIRLDGVLEPRIVTETNNGYQIGSITKFQNKNYLQIDRSGSLSSILGLWYKAHGK